MGCLIQAFRKRKNPWLSSSPWVDHNGIISVVTEYGSTSYSKVSGKYLKAYSGTTSLKLSRDRISLAWIRNLMNAALSSLMEVRWNINRINK